LKKTFQLIKYTVLFTILILPSQVMGLDNGLVEERCYEKPLSKIGDFDIWKTITSDDEMIGGIVENRKFINKFSKAINIQNPIRAEMNGLKVFSMEPKTRFYLSPNLPDALKGPRNEKMNSQKNKKWWISKIKNMHSLLSNNELDDDGRKFLQELIDETQLLSKMYDKVVIERFAESKNNFFLGYIKSGILQDIYLLCSYNFYNNFNADFHLKAPQDLSFILEVDDTQMLKIEDQILGARLSGKGEFNSVENCISPGQLSLECSVIPLGYDNDVLLILLKRLTIKERYQLSRAKKIGFSNCIISEIQNPRNKGGVQIKEFLKNLSKEVQSAAVEGVNTAKTSEKNLGEAIIQTILGVTEVVLKPNSKLKSINVITCEVEFQNLNIIN
jgi:hypothetical protein